MLRLFSSWVNREMTADEIIFRIPKVERGKNLKLSKASSCICSSTTVASC